MGKSSQALGRKGVGLILGDTAGPAEDLAPLLRQRVRAAAIVIAVAGGLSLLRYLAVGDSAPLAAFIVVIVVNLSIVALLSSRKALSVTVLRALELAVFGVTAVGCVFNFAIRLLAAARAGDETNLLLATNGLVIAFFIIVVLYGLLIPNRPLRTLTVVLPFALAPVVLLYVLGGSEPAVIETVPIVDQLTRTGAGVLLIFAVVTAVFGSYSLSTLRTEVSEARQIGQYKLIKKIGEGGMGEVWEARHALLARPAAIKLISTETIAGGSETPEVTAERFCREARATAQLDSPHTIGIFDFGTTSDSSLYYAMERLHGIDLESLIQRYGALPPERAIHFLRQCCESLAEAHEKGMIHRDIKPANLFSCHLGVKFDFTKVLDFGLVEVTGTQDPSLTQAGSVVGTPAFIPPEALTGAPLDGRSDLYSLGCVAYWLLTGEYVFPLPSVAEMTAAHLQTAPPKPSSHSEHDLPEGLDDLILACLAKEPEGRPQTATELDALLAACKPKRAWTQDRATAWWRLHIL